MGMVRAEVVLPFLLMGVVTYLARCLPLVGLHGRRLSPGLEHALAYASVSALAALVTSDLAAGWGEPPWGLGPRLVAALPVAWVAWRWRSWLGAVVLGLLTHALLTGRIPWEP